MLIVCLHRVQIVSVIALGAQGTLSYRFLIHVRWNRVGHYFATTDVWRIRTGQSYWCKCLTWPADWLDRASSITHLAQWWTKSSIASNLTSLVTGSKTAQSPGPCFQVLEGHHSLLTWPRCENLTSMSRFRWRILHPQVTKQTFVRLCSCLLNFSWVTFK